MLAKLGWEAAKHLLAMLLIAFCCATANRPVLPDEVDDQIRLELKSFYPDSEPFYQVLEIKTTETMNVMNQDVKQEQSQVLTIRWTPQPRRGRNLLVKQQIVAMRMNIDIGGNKIRYDSSDPQQFAAWAGFLGDLQTVELTHVIDADRMCIVQTLGTNEAANKLLKAHPQMKSVIDIFFGKNGTMQRAAQWLTPLAPGRIHKGSSWKRTDEAAAFTTGGLGRWDAAIDCTYLGREMGKDMISLRPHVTWNIGQPANGAFKIGNASNLALDSGSGRILFDRFRGHIESARLVTNVSGTVEIIVGNDASKVDFSQSQEISMTIRDSEKK